jgi:putative lipoic acid-binding regulatory protein
MNEITENQGVLKFPCRFPIKMMGRHESDFRDCALRIIERHVGNIESADIRTMPSSAGNFVSITVTIDATSQQQLDAIYRELSANTAVLVAL